MTVAQKLAVSALGVGLVGIAVISLAAAYLSGVFGSLGPQGASIVAAMIVAIAACFVAYPAWYLRSPKLGAALAGFTAALIALCLLVRSTLYLDPAAEPTDVRIVSLWRGGKRVKRAVVNGDASTTLAKGCEGCIRIVERVVDEGPLPTFSTVLFGLSLVAGRDGVAIEHLAHTRYETPTDLLAQQVSLGVPRFGFLKHRLALDDPEGTLIRLDKPPGRMRRFIVRREDPTGAVWPAPIGSADVNLQRLERAIAAGAHYLARTQSPDGRLLYELDPISGVASKGYNLPRHSGTTLFLAEAARLLNDATLREAATRGVQFLQRATSRCGKHTCIGKGPRPDIGASALALLAYVELERGGDAGRKPEIEQLAAFIRSLQRQDGEFMHIFDRATSKPIDRQMPYYTGEAALALARTGDPRDQRAASAAIRYLTRRGFHIFGERFTFDPEHWTCQALEDLWDREPDETALHFCLEYQERNRRQQFDRSNEIGPYEGGFGPNPFFPPRLTSAGSRTEAAVATLATAARAGVDREEVAALEEQVRRSLAYLMRMQFTPGPTHLFADSERVFGAMPGSPTDLRLRIDLTQHAGSGMVRYARMLRDRAGSRP